MVSAGNAQPTAHRARVRKSSAFKLLARAYPRPSSWRTSVQSQPWPAAEVYRNIDVASGISMAIAHRACVYRGCIPAALGGVPRRWLDCPRKRPASKRQSAPRAAGACSCEGTCTSAAAHHGIKSAIHLIMIFLCALSCIRVVMNAFMFHVCAERPYTTVVTTHSKLFYTYLPYLKNVECGNQFSSSCDSPLNLLLHLAPVQYLHTAQLIGCCEQVGNRITDSVSNSVPSSSCIRLQEQNRTINHWCLSTPYTKEMLSTPIHSCSSRAILC